MDSPLPSDLGRLLQARGTAARDRAWQDFLHAYGRLLLHTARRTSADHDAAMDSYAAVLEALRADDHRRLRDYAPRHGARFTTWLVVVVRRICLDHQRRRYGRVAEPAAASGERLAARRRLADLLGADVDLEALSGPAPDDPAADLESRETAGALMAAVAMLPPGDQLLIRLRFTDGLSVPRIARLLRLPTPFHAYRRLNAVLADLKRRLDRRGIHAAHE